MSVPLAHRSNHPRSILPLGLETQLSSRHPGAAPWALNSEALSKVSTALPGKLPPPFFRRKAFASSISCGPRALLRISRTSRGCLSRCLCRVPLVCLSCLVPLFLFYIEAGIVLWYSHTSS